jgi:membrane protease YdiL (CAAX protease family)
MTTNKSSFQKKQLSTLARVLFFYTCSLAVLMFTSRITKTLSPQIADLLSIILAVVLTFILVYLFTSWEKLHLADVGLMPGKDSIRRFAAGYGIGLTMSILQGLTVLSFGHLHLTLVPHITATQIILPFLLYLFIACREELVFRSYSLRSLDFSFSSLIALIIITAIFILEHVIAGVSWKMAIIGSGLGGVLFGVAALKSRGLALPLGLHSAWNFGQWVVGFKNKPGIWNAVVDKGFEKQTENISLTAFAIVMLLAIIAIILFYKRKTKQSTKPLTDFAD